eukprot:12352550-Karenia_brevis.AAC.1
MGKDGAQRACNFKLFGRLLDSNIVAVPKSMTHSEAMLWHRQLAAQSLSASYYAGQTLPTVH